MVILLYILDTDVIIAGKTIFHLTEDDSHSFQWKNYGFRFYCPKGAVLKDTKLAVTAIVTGPFKVPKGTMLVSAVYAISVSKPLLKPITIELQHCMDLRNDDQTHCLKFVRATSESYEFNIVEGGFFNVGDRYGSIKRDQFSGMGIVAEMSDEDESDNEESSTNSSQREQGKILHNINSLYDIESDDEDSSTSEDVTENRGDTNEGSTSQSQGTGHYHAPPILPVNIQYINFSWHY